MADKRGRKYNPEKDAARKRKQRLDPERRARINKQQAESHVRHREKRIATMRNWWFVKNYGITAAEKDQMVKDAKGLCQICFALFKDKRDTHLDHDHVTGVIRGVLCGSCNRKLGWFEKNQSGVTSYLTKR